MREFLGFIKKEFVHILRDFRTMTILFGLPVVQILIFGFVIRNEIRNVKIAVLDFSKDDATYDILRRVTSSGFFVIDKYLASVDEIEKVFQEGKIREVLVFENYFASKLEREGLASVQIICDASDPTSANLIVNYSRGIITSYLKDINRNTKIPFQIKPVVRMMYNPDLKSAFMFVPGTMAMVLMLVCALMTSVSIAREKETGTMEALLVSPLRPMQILAGKVMPYILLSCINAAVILIIGHYVFNLPVRGNIWLLFTVTILFITLALSLGIMISSVSSSQQMAMFVSAFALMLPTILLSGFIFPIENMPKVLQWLSYVVPPKYFIITIRSIMLKGAGITEVWKEILVMVFMITAFIGISFAKFKVRLE